MDRVGILSNKPVSIHHVEHLLITVMEWSKKSAPDWWDDSFVHSLYIQYYEGKDLSPRQVAALENICTKFKIE